MPGSLNPDLERRIASLTAVTARSCPTTLFSSSFSRCRSLSASPSSIFWTGMPVHLETIWAIKVHRLLPAKGGWAFRPIFSGFFDFFLQFWNGVIAQFSDFVIIGFPFCFFFLKAELLQFIFFFLQRFDDLFFLFPLLPRIANSSLIWAIWPSSFSTSFLEWGIFPFHSLLLDDEAANSLSLLSMGRGRLPSCIRIKLAASSIRSIALSGRRRSVM